MKKEEKTNFHFVYVTDEDIKRENEKIVSELKEEQKSEFIFNGEYFYNIGCGHCFVRGFFIEYITKSGIKAQRYGQWYIGGDLYEYENSEFVKISVPERNMDTTNLYNLNMPIVKNANTKSLANDLIAVKPMKNDKQKFNKHKNSSYNERYKYNRRTFRF